MSFFAAIKLVLTLVCDDASHLVSDAMDRRLTRVERTALGLHLLICRNCRRFRRQIAFIRAAVHQMIRSASSDDPAKSASLRPSALSPEARRRIGDALRRA